MRRPVRLLGLRDVTLDLEGTDRLISDRGQLLGILPHIVGHTPPAAVAE